MIQSEFLDLKNKFCLFCQEKTRTLVDNSVILTKIDDIIFAMIGLTLIASTFMQSEKIGLIALCVSGLTLIKLLIQKGAKIRLTPWDISIFVYFTTCFISTINSTLLSQSIHGFLKTVVYILFYYSVANYFQTNQNKIKYIFLLIAGLCTFEGIIALLQNFSGVEQIATWQDSNYINPEDAIARAYGTLKPYNPNLLGGYLLAGIPFVFGTSALFLINKSKKHFIAGMISFAICTLAVLVTGSRGAYLGLGAILAGIILITGLIIKSDFSKQERLKQLYKKAITLMMSCLVLILIAVPKITKRLLSIFILRGDSSTSFRMNVYNSSWQMFCDNWILGIGAGNQTFREIYGLYMLTGFDALSTYSVPLEIAVESGILGLIAFASFIVLFLLHSLKLILNPNPKGLAQKVIVSSAILTIFGVMMHGLFDTIYFRPQVQFLFWLMIAVASSVIMNNKIEE